MNKVENRYIDNGFQFDVSMEEIKFEKDIVLYHIDSIESLKLLKNKIPTSSTQ